MKSEKGFSLLEVMIALLILGVGLLGIAGMMTVGVRVNADAAHLTEAYQIGQAEMERLKLVPWNTLGSGSSTREMRGISFTSSWSVLSTVGRVKDVNLAVTWNEGYMGDGTVKEHRIDLRSKISR